MVKKVHWMFATCNDFTRLVRNLNATCMNMGNLHETSDFLGNLHETYAISQTQKRGMWIRGI